MLQVRRLRLNRGWSQRELAERVGVTRPFISMIEAGKANPTQDKIERIARALNVPVSVLFEEPSQDPHPATAARS